MDLKFIGKNEENPKTGFREFKMQESDKQRFINYFKSLPEGMYYLTIHKVKKVKTGKQRRYFHGVILEILRSHIGFFDVNEVKERIIKPQFLKMKFQYEGDEVIYIDNPYFEPDPDILESARILFTNGYEVHYPTEKLSTREQENLNSAIREWAAIEYNGLYIPLPNEYT